MYHTIGLWSCWRDSTNCQSSAVVEKKKESMLHAIFIFLNVDCRALELKIKSV